jgi:hypothetical protein
MSLQDIVEEWQGGCFYDTEKLSEAFLTFLTKWTHCGEPIPTETEVGEFLDAGYRAYLAQLAASGRADPSIHMLVMLAKSMVGSGVTTRAAARRQAEASPERTDAAQQGAPEGSPCKAGNNNNNDNAAVEAIHTSHLLQGMPASRDLAPPPLRLSQDPAEQPRGGGKKRTKWMTERKGVSQPLKFYKLVSGI